MIIDNEFTIAQYDGHSDLELTNGVPDGIVADSLQHTQYNKFISNIKFIYGSQLPDGSIPTLFKNPDNTISNQSTLDYLKSGHSYYFVSYTKNPMNGLKTVFPYYVPVVSGVAEGSTDHALVTFNNPAVIYVEEDACINPIPLTATVSHAINGFPYSFRIKATGINGSPTVVPESGTILCNSDAEGTLPMSVLFNTANNAVITVEIMKSNDLVCTDSVVMICGEQAIDTPVQAQSFVSSNVSTPKINEQFLSQLVSSTCPQEYINIGKPDIFLNHDKIVYLNDNDLTNPMPISASVINTKKDNYEYNYEFNIVSDTGNPEITPVSGSVYANTYKCDNASSYSSGNFSAMLSLNGAKTAVVNVKLIDKGKVLDNDYINVVYKTDKAYTDFQTYVGCPLIVNSGNIVNMDQSNNGSVNISNVISDLSIGRKYYYSFEGVSANWPAYVYPRSGTFYADSTTITLDNMFVFDSTLNDGCVDCFPYTTGAAYSETSYQKKFSIIKLNVRPETPGCIDGTDKYINIYCDDCLIQPTPTSTPTPTVTPTVSATPGPTPTPTTTTTPSSSSFIVLNQANNWTFSVNNQIIARFTPVDSSLNNIEVRINSSQNVTVNSLLPSISNIIANNVSYGQLLYSGALLESKPITIQIPAPVGAAVTSYSGLITTLNTNLA